MIAAEKTNFPVAVMCRVLSVSRTGFHNWERRAPSDRALSDAWLTEKIKRIHEDSRGVYGAPRIHAELRMEHDVRVGRKRVARLMKAAGITGTRPRKRYKTTIRVPGITPATDLVERQFRPDHPNVLWVADITYLRTGEGWLYLAAVQDAYSRQIVGWAMATHTRASLVIDALQMALARRRPDPGLIHHSDQGSQYVSLAFGRATGEAGIAISMGSRGDAYDNAVAETFFATLKKELVNRRSWPTRLELQSAVFEYIDAFYNRQRRHSALGMLSPVGLRTATTLADTRLRSISITTTINRQTPCDANRGKSKPAWLLSAQARSHPRLEQMTGCSSEQPSRWHAPEWSFVEQGALCGQRGRRCCPRSETGPIWQSLPRRSPFANRGSE